MGNPEHSWRAAGPQAIEPAAPVDRPDAGLPAARGMGRRAFVWSAVRGSVGLAAALTLPGRLLAQAAGSTVAAGRVPQPESTRKMAALLAKISREADPMRNPFRNAEQAALLREMLGKATDPQQILQGR